jgi:hypothetical protein|nr:MAG TPA: hypothetical protein [Caudoviricetes sp.]
MAEDNKKELINECQEKYAELIKQTVIKALTGEISTNSAMVKELESLNFQYHEEMDEYDDTAPDLNPELIENFRQAENTGKNVSIEAQEYLLSIGMCEEMFNQKMWVNEDGHMCDEDGNRLSADREHRVFEVVKCGK